MWEWLGDSAVWISDKTVATASKVGDVTVSTTSASIEALGDGAVWTSKKTGQAAVWTYEAGKDATIWSAAKTGEAAKWSFDQGVSGTAWSLNKSGEAINWTFEAGKNAAVGTAQAYTDTCLWLDEKLMGCADMRDTVIDAVVLVAAYCLDNQEQCEEIGNGILAITQGTPQ